MLDKPLTAGFWPTLFDPFREFGARVANWVAPRAEAKAAGDAYEITLELPGVAMENIDLSVQDGALTVKGEKRSERTESDKSYYFTEREYGAFLRSFRLPGDADDAAIAASFKDGVLTLRIPKKAGAAAAGGRKIAIAAN